MKKVFVSIMGLVVLSAAAIPAGAQTRARYNNQSVVRKAQSSAQLQAVAVQRFTLTEFAIRIGTTTKFCG